MPRPIPAGALILTAAMAACSTGPAEVAPTTGAASTPGTSPATTAPPPTTGPRDTTGATSAPSDAPPGTTDAPVPASTTGPAAPPSPGDLVLVPIVEDLMQPVLALPAPGSDVLHIVDQVGRIVTADGEVVLDIAERVLFDGEQGMLGLAFHDDFADTGRMVVSYIDNTGDTVVSEFVAGDPDSERLILGIEQPAANHNGGMIAFGPDGNLWLGMGDGGGADDEFGNGQNAASLLGGMLRIDLSGEPYTSPDDNPRLDGWAPEKWAIGLRNPWRWAFDGDRLWIADVGQGDWEEINVVDVGPSGADGGLNFGWPILEGTHCFAEDPCDPGGTVAPVVEYSHDEGCSVTGGFVYRGAAIPALDGHYFYGDYCGGWVRSVVVDGDAVTDTEWFPPGTVEGITGFGVDAAGELYVTSTDGSVYRIELG